MLAGVMAMSNCDIKYSGDNCSFKTNLTNPVYTVAGNSSDLEGLEVNFEKGNITISTNPLMASDTFTMIFFDNITNEVIKEIKVGGGTRTIYKDRNITVIKPIFLDRNKTIEVQINNCTNETITIPEENIEPKRNFIIRFFKWIWGIFT